MPVSTKAESLYDEIKRRIGTMDAGMRLPSVRELVSEYQVSLVTADRVMSRLTNDGLVVRQVGKGTFVAGRPGQRSGSRSYRVGIAVPAYPSMFWDIVVSKMIAQIEKNGYRAAMIRYDIYSMPALARENIDAAAILLPSRDLDGQHLTQLKNMGMPVVLLDRVLRGMAIDCVGTDNEFGAALAADHLIKLNHRKLAIVNSEPKSNVTESRISGFRRQAHLAGIDDVRVYECHCASGEFTVARAYAAIRERIASGTLDATGLFLMSDSCAPGVYKALLQAGIALPQQMSIVGFDDIPTSEFMHPSLTVIRQNIDAIALEAVAILESRLVGQTDGVIQKSVAPTLIVRESTQRID